MENIDYIKVDSTGLYGEPVAGKNQMLKDNLARVRIIKADFLSYLNEVNFKYNLYLSKYERAVSQATGFGSIMVKGEIRPQILNVGYAFSAPYTFADFTQLKHPERYVSRAVLYFRCEQERIKALVDLVLTKERKIDACFERLNAVENNLNNYRDDEYFVKCSRAAVITKLTIQKEIDSVKNLMCANLEKYSSFNSIPSSEDVRQMQMDWQKARTNYLTTIENLQNQK